jgi:hypothetical protein
VRAAPFAEIVNTEEKEAWGGRWKKIILFWIFLV